MTDIGKVLTGLKCLITNEVPCEGCPYNGSGYCMKNIAKDALELLKEQEPVNPRFIDGKRNHFVKCGNCNFNLMHGMKFCPHCGRAVKWDAAD